MWVATQRLRARALVGLGRNIIAVHMTQTRGGQFVDVAIVDVRDRR